MLSKTRKMRGRLLKLDKRFKSYEHLKIEKNEENNVTPGVTSKS